MEKDLKVINFIIKNNEDEDIGQMDGIAIVADPAMEAQAFFFKKTDDPMPLNFSSDERMEVTGLAMRANKKILRYDKKKDEYFYCVFSEKTIRQCAQLFFKNKANLKVNLEHISSIKLPQAYVFESWVVEDPSMDKANSLGIPDVQKGDWFISLKVDNKQAWQELKQRYSEGYGGFSVEGLFVNGGEIEEPDVEVYKKMLEIIENKRYTDEVKLKKIEDLTKNWTK